MLVQHPDFEHEFPEYQALAHRLRETDPSFANLLQSYEELDQRIIRAEEDIEPMADKFLDQLKRERLHLKDALYAHLQAVRDGAVPRAAIA